jgi:hypothetical protein
MKYKVGDRVRIKTWDQMVKEFGRKGNNGYHHEIPCHSVFVDSMEQDLRHKFPDRIVTIREVSFCHESYRMQDLGWNWSDDMIEGLESELREKEKNRLVEMEIGRFLLIDFD